MNRASPAARVVVAVVAWTLNGHAAASAQAPARPDDGRPVVAMRWSVKATGLFSEPARMGLARWRIEPTFRLPPRVTITAAYEHRFRAMAGSGGNLGAGLAVLPTEAPPPYRLRALDWEIAGGGAGVWRHEVDRTSMQVDAGRVHLTAGRQAVGWGRGVLFGAIDLFAPFSPLEVDREWRRGIDAVRIDAQISARASADVVAAFDARQRPTYAARFRGYAGDVDVEAVAGRRADDAFGGAASSFAVGPAEIHAEIAAFRLPASPESPVSREPRTVIKSVVGGSSRLAVGTGLLVHVEFHYSGFGADGAAAIASSFQDPDFAARMTRGDSQILTRHALAVVASYEWSPLVAGSVALVQEPVDGSGVITPALTLTFSDRWSLLANGYLSFGRAAPDGAPASAYGQVPRGALVQIAIYR